jgi:serine/threonine protein kinase
MRRGLGCSEETDLFIFFHNTLKRRSPDGTNWLEPLAYGQVCAFAGQILEGLQQLHREGITIRDLKPRNLLVDENEELIIADYGLATGGLTGASTAQSTTQGGGGTYAYMAPEQYNDEDFGKVGPPADMWALGCVVIEMLTGSPPWRGLQPPQITMRVGMKGQSPPIPSQATGRGPLLELLQRCFTPVQADRPTAQEALAILQAEGYASAGRRRAPR